MKKLLVTGGAGFIGSHFVRLCLNKGYHVMNVDKLNYAGNLDNLKDVENHKNYDFLQGDINNRALMSRYVEKADVIINFAAESHVDNSIKDSKAFLNSNVLGVHNLLELCKEYKKSFVQISTDEVYGSTNQNSFDERSKLNPGNPYSASKASAEMFCMAYHKTFGVDVKITRSSNNYGPNQYPEKLLSKAITNLLRNQKIPVYGDGTQVRDWLYVEDNCEAILKVMTKGKSGEIYNISGYNEQHNIDVLKKVLKYMGKSDKYLEFVKDRPGHDVRYSIFDDKVRKLGWKPKYDFKNFDRGLKKTVDWYMDNEEWWQKLIHD